MSTASNWDIIGHEWAVAHLAARLAAGRLRHAILFTGIAGVGKTALAVRLAQAINCTGSEPPCLTCRACDLIERAIHPDLLIVAPDGASIKIEQIRDLQAALFLRPVEARYHVAVILEAHRLTDSAADALLKTLEEPPATACLLLTAPVAESVRATVASRCQVIGLRPVPTAQIQSALTARLGLAPEQASQIAPLAAGRPGAAITMARRDADSAETDTPEGGRVQLLIELLAALRGGRKTRFAYAEALAGRAATLIETLEVCQAWWRDVLLLAEGSQTQPVNTDSLPTLDEVARAVGPQGARRAVRAVQRTITLLGTTNVNTRLALDVMLLEMPYL